MRELVLRLLREPAFGAAAEDLDSLTAISGEIPRFPFTSSDSVVRVTPRAVAASVMRQAQRLDALAQHKASGVRRILHRHGSTSFSGNRHNQRPGRRRQQSGRSPASLREPSRPKALQFALQGMQPEPRQIHIRNRTGRIEPRENVTQLFRVFGVHAARVVFFVKAFQSLVAYRPDHSRTVTRHVTDVRRPLYQECGAHTALVLPLDRHPDAVAAAEAERRDAALQVAPLQRVEQRRQHAPAARADRVAERDGAAVHVDLLRVDPAR